MRLSLVLASNGNKQVITTTSPLDARRDAQIMLRNQPLEQAVYIVEGQKILDIVRRCNLASECTL